MTTKIACPAGSYCPVGSHHPIPCPIGTHRIEIGASKLENCVACPAGKYCDLPGLSTAVASLPNCAAGFFCKEGSPAKEPKDDPDGNYGPCPEGKYCLEG